MKSMAEIRAGARVDASTASTCYQVTKDGRNHAVLTARKAAFMDTALSTFEVMRAAGVPIPDGHLALLGTLAAVIHVETQVLMNSLAKMTVEAPPAPGEVQRVVDYPVRLLAAIEGFQDLLEASDLPPSPFAPIPRS